MTDQDLDRALADALDVEPQADFLARVRTEVARQPAPSAWPGWWRIAAATTAAAVVVIAAYWPAREDEPAIPARTVARVEPPATPAPAAQTVARIEPAAALPRRAGQVAVRAVPLALPAPQISSQDADLLRHTLAGASAGLFAPSAARDAAAPLTVSGIELPPIAVMPLAQMTQLDSGELQ
jgi:hypothetical protein